MHLWDILEYLNNLVKLCTNFFSFPTLPTYTRSLHSRYYYHYHPKPLSPNPHPLIPPSSLPIFNISSPLVLNYFFAVITFYIFSFRIYIYTKTVCLAHLYGYMNNFSIFMHKVLYSFYSANDLTHGCSGEIKSGPMTFCFYHYPVINVFTTE